MAKKSQTQAPEIVGLPIEWTESTSASVFANQMIVQTDEHNCYLSFYEVAPPLMPGGDEVEQRKRLSALSSVKARCVAKIVLNAEKMENFANAIMATAIRYKAVRDADHNSDGKEG